MTNQYDHPPADQTPHPAAGPAAGPATGPPPPDDAGPIGEQLLSQAQTIARLRADLDELAQHSTDTLVDLVDRLESLESPTGRGGGTPAAWCWRDLGRHATDELWGQLTGWVDWLRGRYPLARKIPPCWAKHPETVEELTALWLVWQAAYTEPNPAPTAAADWHDRWLPGLLYRLEHGPFALDCATGHRARPTAAYATNAAAAQNGTGRDRGARAKPTGGSATVHRPQGRDTPKSAVLQTDDAN